MRWSTRAPAEVRAALELRRGEHVLSAAPTRGGSHVVATTTALHVPDGSGGFTRLPWEQVEQASWTEDWLHIRTRTDEYRVHLTVPGAVPEIVQERVTATIVVSHHVQFPAGGGVRIVGRRSPVSGPPTVRGSIEPHWSFVFDPGLDPADPGLLARAEQALENLRRQTGLD